MRKSATLLDFLKALGSLRLSVYLLVAATVLVFFGTLDQVRIGIREAQKIYFESFIAVWHYPETWPMGKFLNWFPLPLPGGYLIGPLLAINLICSHVRHFRPRWSIAGITLIHIGILMLLAGQLVTNIFQEEHYMWLDEGESANFVRSFSQDELYLTRINPDGTMGILSYAFDDLKEGRRLEAERFPFELLVKRVFPNAEIKPGGTIEGRSQEGVNRGIGVQFDLGVRRVASFHSDDQRDVRTAVVEVIRDGVEVGTWLVSNVFEDRFPEQTFRLDGVEYALGLRFKKSYLPFTVTLLEFTHDRYPGTNIPSNFASRVRVDHSDGDELQEVKIFMNHPLRFEGLTFYQASFAKQDTASMFHVVRNPGRLLPYIACLLVTIGLLYQFGWIAYRMNRRKDL